VRDALRRGADGALAFDGSPSGTVYLLDGCVAHIETSEVPDLGERLVAAGRLSAAQWGAARAGVDRGARVPDVLDGFGLDRHELAALTESVLVDSILTVLAEPVAGAHPGRFAPGARPAAHPDLRLDEAAVQDVLAQRPADPVRTGIRSASVVEPAPPDWRWRVLTADEWRALCDIGERARIRDLARSSGRGVHEVVDQVADLVRAGLCVVRPDAAGGAMGTAAARAPGAAEGSAPIAGPTAGGRVDVDQPAGLPRRVPGESLPPVTAVPDGALQGSLAVRPPGLDVRAPDAQTLRRLLGSLQRMD
jgi:hypothetical protein